MLGGEGWGRVLRRAAAAGLLGVGVLGLLAAVALLLRGSPSLPPPFGGVSDPHATVAKIEEARVALDPLTAWLAPDASYRLATHGATLARAAEPLARGERPLGYSEENDARTRRWFDEALLEMPREVRRSLLTLAALYAAAAVLGRACIRRAPGILAVSVLVACAGAALALRGSEELVALASPGLVLAVLLCVAILVERAVASPPRERLALSAFGLALIAGGIGVSAWLALAHDRSFALTAPVAAGAFLLGRAIRRRPARRG